MICSTCGAILEDDKPVILRQGNCTKLKLYNRVCLYAIERGKDCINDIRVIDKSQSWDAEYERLEKDFKQKYDYLIQEM
jgi:uncharacterized C2H2 Zn-finger protein